MMKRIAAVFFLVLLVSLLASAQTEPELISVDIPTYPPLARQGHVSGIVKVKFTLPASANAPANVEAVSGPSILSRAAIENVETWRFHNPSAVDQQYETTLEYKLGVSKHALFESFQRVEIGAPDPPPGQPVF